MDRNIWKALLSWTINVQGGVLFFFLSMVFIASDALATDFVPHPPEREAFVSPTGTYQFVLSTPDHWKSRKSIGELYQVTEDASTLLWARPLLQEYRPRYVLVGPDGQVVLLDEWLNVKSRYAVVILNRHNHLVVQYDFDAVQTVLDVPAATLVRMAGLGWWIMEPPTIDVSGEHALVKAGGMMLSIRLSDGRLGLAP